MLSVIPLTGAFTAYIALSNLTLRLNSVSFATISKVRRHEALCHVCVSAVSGNPARRRS